MERENSNLTENEMQHVYQQISIIPDTNFDLNELTQTVNDLILEKFGEDFSKNLKTSEKLSCDQVLLNDKFTQILKYLVEKDIKKTTKYDINIGLLFVIFCDYFNLDYNNTFNIIHPNIQEKIKNSLKKMIGKYNYKKYENIVKKEQGLNGLIVRKLF